MNSSFLDRFQRGALIAGLAGAALCIAGIVLGSPEQFFRSYLVAFLFWQGLSLGSLGILMLVYLMGGRWGFLIRQPLEAGAKTLWLAALLFAPLVFGLASLYPWARPEALAADPLLQAKSLYLNVPFFLIRTALYFIIWIILARLLIGWSQIPEYTSDPVLRRRFQRVSALGLILYVLAMTFASIDWIMSLQPEWVSTIFGLLIITGQALAGLALGIAVLPLIVDIPPVSSLAHPGRFRDLGALLLTMVVLWAYIAFSQYLIIWSGNIPREATWYLNRSAGGWTWVILLVILVQFALPFAVLLSLRAKRNLRVIAGLSLVILAVRWLDIFWLVAPNFHPQGFTLHWLDLAATLATGGLWLAAFAWQLKHTPAPVLPVHLLQDEAVSRAREHTTIQ